MTNLKAHALILCAVLTCNTSNEERNLCYLCDYIMIHFGVLMVCVCAHIHYFKLNQGFLGGSVG